MFYMFEEKFNSMLSIERCMVQTGDYQFGQYSNYWQKKMCHSDDDHEVDQMAKNKKSINKKSKAH